MISPAKLHAAFTYLSQNFPVAPLTQSEFSGCCEAVLDSLDPAALPADLLVLVGDLYLTEAPAAGAIPAGAAYRRVASILQASETVPSRDGLFRLRPLGALYRFCPGLFLAATRDPNTSSLSLVLEQCRPPLLACKVNPL